MDGWAERRILEAGLFHEHEESPAIQPELLDLENPVLSSNIGCISRQAIHASVLCFMKSMELHLADEPLFISVLDSKLY
ncbi:hypothetical protein D3C85_1636790 [compost metagenome]